MLNLKMHKSISIFETDFSDFMNKKLYNIVEKSISAQIHLKSGFKLYAKRYNKIPYFFRRKSNYEVWWIFSDSSILSKIKFSIN